MLSNKLPNGMTLLQKNPDFAVDLTGGKWHGWLFSKGGDNQWVSNRKLAEWEVMQAEDQAEDGLVIHSPTVRSGYL